MAALHPTLDTNQPLHPSPSVLSYSFHRIPSIEKKQTACPVKLCNNLQIAHLPEFGCVGKYFVAAILSVLKI